MANFKIEYLGNLQCKTTHSDTNQNFITDATNDNNGISPTDLLASALATCTASMIGFSAKKHNINVDGMEIIATREMNMQEHKIQSIKLVVTFKNPVTNEDLKILKAVAKACPVKKALSDDVEVIVEFL